MKVKVVGTLVVGLAIAILGIAGGAETKVTMNELPAAVRQAITARAQGGSIRGLSMEVKNGKKIYEAELTMNGRNTDISLDEQGNLIEAELTTTLDKIPAPARDAIQKQAGTGSVLTVEEVTEKGKTIYEAEIDRAGKKSEIKVDANGHPAR